jgi:hypothetical protein
MLLGYEVELIDYGDSMKALFILNDGPYGSERNYNALRLARSLLKAGGRRSQSVFDR